MAPVKQNYKVYQGSTFQEVIRWESSTKSYAIITGITKSAPMVVTAPLHGLPAGWRCKISSVLGMKEINSDEYLVATTISQDTLTFNAVNSTGYGAYTSGGVVEFNKPISLSGYTARMQIREKPTSDTIIQELTTQNGGIVLDDTNKTITILIPATTTAGFTFKSAVYSLELSNAGVVTQLITGALTTVMEITR